MTSQSKASVATSLDLSGIVNGQPIDAANVTVPLGQSASAIDSARYSFSVTANDTHVKNLNDALEVASNLTKTLINPGGDEVIQISLGTNVVTISGEQTLSNKTLDTPVITSFSSSQHSHEDGANGGLLNASNIFSGGTVPLARLPLMVGATDLTAGAAGLVVQPLAGDEDNFLAGDGTFKSPPGSTPMTGATADDPGTSGTVPQPLAGDNTKYLSGDGTWKEIAGSTPVMTGATGSSNGVAGSVPQPLTGDHVRFLRGDASWVALVAGDIPDLDAGKTTTGTFADARIPNLNASKITAGTLPIARGGTNGTTANAGFNNLSPMTANGDIIWRNSFVAQRLAVGSPGQSLTVISASTLGYRHGLVQIGSATRLVSAAASFSITSIPADFWDLVLVLTYRTTDSNNLAIRLNNNSTLANYYTLNTRIAHSASLNTTQRIEQDGYIRLNNTAVEAGETAGLFTQLVVEFLDYSNTTTSKSLILRGFKPGTTTGTLQAISGGGYFAPTGAINRLDIFMESGNLAAGSSYTLFGRGG